MKNKLIRNVSLFLSTLLITQTLLTGCGNNNSSVKETINIEEDLKVDENGKVNGLMYEKGLPLVDKGEYEFSLFVDNSTPLEGQFMWKMLEDQTNVKVNVQQNDYAIASEKYGLALSSGDYADVIAGWLISGNDILKYGADMGVFIPLEGYIEKYAPNIQKVLEIPGVREEMTAPDGHIYSIPYVEKAPKVHFNPFINQKWLDNLGLKMPTTTEEFRKVLKEFKEKDANGNGDPNDEIPFSADPNHRNLGPLAGWFGIPMTQGGFTLDEEGKLKFVANSEEYKKFIEYMASLNAEGLIDPEYFTQDRPTWRGKGDKELYGVSIAYWSEDFKKIPLGKVPDYKPLPVLKSPETDKPTWIPNSDGIITRKTQMVITDKAKNPEVIIRWFDNLYEVDNSFQSKYGPFGITTEKIGENHYKLYDRSKLDPKENEKYSFDNIFCQALPRNIPIDIIKDEESPKLYDEKEDTDKVYEPYLIDKMKSYWVTEEYASKLAEYSKAIEDHISKKTAEWISGQGDINKEWDSYCKQLEKLGLEEYIKINKELVGES